MVFVQSLTPPWLGLLPTGEGSWYWQVQSSYQWLSPWVVSSYSCQGHPGMPGVLTGSRGLYDPTCQTPNPPEANLLQLTGSDLGWAGTGTGLAGQHQRQDALGCPSDPPLPSIHSTTKGDVVCYYGNRGEPEPIVLAPGEPGWDGGCSCAGGILSIACWALLAAVCLGIRKTGLA